MKESVEHSNVPHPADAVTQTLVDKDVTRPHWSEKGLSADTGFIGFLASPRAVMILVPLLVVVLGATLTLIGQTALTATSKKMAEQRFASQTSALSLRLTSGLSQAEPILDELVRIARNEVALRLDHAPPSELVAGGELTQVAREMSDLLVARPAITQAYIAYPDGLFVNAAPAPGSEPRFEVTDQGRLTSFLLAGKTLAKKETRPSQYDPTKRDWYLDAKNSGERIWSQPYTFYLNHRVGITRSQPVFADDEKQQLLYVVGVDFDVDTLTEFMRGAESDQDDVNSVVFTLGGVVLAYPAGAEKLSQLPRSEAVPTHLTLGDARVSQLIERVQDQDEQGTLEKSFYFKGSDDTNFASLTHLGTGGPDWFVATFSRRRSVLADLYSYRRSSLLVGSLALLIAAGLSWLLARRLLYVRKAASLAQAAVVEAQEHIRDLGSYRLISLIGEGGMGEVWRARHRLLARDAAIKVIKTGSHSEHRLIEQRERFRREARAIARLRSRNTVALFDYGVTQESTLFYVMELLDGIDLSTLVVKHGPQPAERVRKILMQACNSLSEAHQAGLVHRDIKPANLVLCREAEEVDVVKLLDFGLVFQPTVSEAPSHGLGVFDSQSATVTGEVRASSPTDPARITHFEHQLGTPAFMSPEQAMGSDLDGRSDLYSLACVAWWLLTGEPLFHADSAMGVMIMHADSPLPDLQALLKSPVPEAFITLIKECLSKSMEDRPQTAGELRLALGKLGPIEPPWTEAEAQAWWSKEMPQTEDERQRSLPPLGDAKIIVPRAG